MKNRILIISSIIIAYVSFATKLQSQVTIGTQATPLKGSLLDLKQWDESTGKETSTIGIMYPRVALSNINELYPILTGSESDYIASKPSYAGLIVYNVTEDTNIPLQKGLYVWDGAKWNSVQTGGQTVAPLVAGNGLSLSHDSVVLGGSLNRNTVVDLNNKNLAFSNTGNVGIGTESPEVALDVAGDEKVSSTLSVGDTLTANGLVFLKSLSTAPTSGKTIAQLGVDPTGQVYTLGTGTNTYPLNFIIYQFTAWREGTGNTQRRLTITDYDTKIPSDKYTLIVVGSKLANLGAGIGQMRMMQSGTGDFAPESVYAFDSGGTWHLTADYPGATMYDSNSGTWTLYCLAINHSMVKDIPGQNISMPVETGAAGSTPEGL